MLVSSNERSLLKSFCSLVGDAASVAGMKPFSLSRILTIQEPQSLPVGCACMRACVCDVCGMAVWSEACIQYMWDVYHVY